MDDTRNVIDRYKGWSHDDIVADLDTHGSPLEIAIENLERDFNMGTIVRSANAFGVRRIHIIGRRQWNKRGAMMTDKYLRMVYHESVKEFVATMKRAGRRIVIVDNIEGAVAIESTELYLQDVLVFGSERSGISSELALTADLIVAISQYGSTRSLNVGVAAGIALYEWTRQQEPTIDKNARL